MMETSKKIFPTIGIIGGWNSWQDVHPEVFAVVCSCKYTGQRWSRPASVLANHHIVGSITDGHEIQKLADISDVLTWEIEHIDVDKLIELQQEGKTIIPNPEILKPSRIRENRNYFIRTTIYQRHSLAVFYRSEITEAKRSWHTNYF